MLILGLLGMYFDAAVVFVTNSLLLFRLAVAILCKISLTTYLKFRHCKKAKKFEKNSHLLSNKPDSFL